MPPTLSHWDSLFFRWILYFQTISQVFFFLGLVAFFPLIFAVFRFVLVKQDTENGQKEDGNSIAHPHLLTGLNLKPSLNFSLFFIPVDPDWHWGSLIELPRSLSGSRIHLQCRRHRRCGFDPWVRKIPWKRKWQPAPVFLLGKTPWTEESGRL